MPVEASQPLVQSRVAPIAPESTPEFRRAVPCCGHSFDESLECRCGADWWGHQLHPAQCPVNARGQNRHALDKDAPE